ncbi:MAG: T9SS type A sorting domain-containing protein [Sphingobacteriales bacterium]|nr:T9SS type A sorting domain-containing protein [Sphingobacteriales bacterium]
MATLKFTLQENSRVRVNIYDINGKLVQQVSNAMTAAGTHQVEIPASHLPAGNYFVQLQTDNSASTLKMTVVR